MRDEGSVCKWVFEDGQERWEGEVCRDLRESKCDWMWGFGLHGGGEHSDCLKDDSVWKEGFRDALHGKRIHWGPSIEFKLDGCFPSSLSKRLIFDYL